MKTIVLSLLLSMSASAALAQEVDPIFGTPEMGAPVQDAPYHPTPFVEADLDAQFSPANLIVKPGEVGTATLHLSRSAQVSRLDAAAQVTGLALGQTLPAGETTLTIAAPKDANGGYAVTVGLKDSEGSVIVRTLTLTIQNAPVQNTPTTPVPSTGDSVTPPKAQPQPSPHSTPDPSPTPGPTPPVNDRTKPDRTVKHNPLFFGDAAIDAEPGSFINNACLITWPGASTTTDYSVPVKVGQVDAGLSIKLLRDYVRPGSCNDSVISISANAAVGSLLRLTIVDQEDASNTASFTVQVVPKGTLALVLDSTNPLPQATSTPRTFVKRNWTVAFAPNPAAGRPGETVTVPIVVSGMGSKDGYLEGANLVFDQLLPAPLGGKMLSTMYQKTFDAGTAGINTQLYPVNAESQQALQIIVPKDAPSGAYQIRVTLTDNVFDTSAVLNFAVSASATNNGIQDVATWQLGPLEPLLFSVTSTPPGSSCGITAGLRTGTPAAPGRTIFRPSVTCAPAQGIMVRARWPLDGKTAPGELFTAPQIPWTLSRDGRADQGYRFLETQTWFQYEFSLDGGVSWFVAQRPR